MKRVLRWLMVLVMAFGLSACGADSGDSNTTVPSGGSDSNTTVPGGDNDSNTTVPGEGDSDSVPNLASVILLGTTVSNSIEESAWKYYKVSVSDQFVKIVLDDLSADLDLYVRIGSEPDSRTYTCQSNSSGTDAEKCIISVEGSEDVYIGVYGYEAGSYSLVVKNHDGTPPVIIFDPNNGEDEGHAVVINACTEPVLPKVTAIDDTDPNPVIVDPNNFNNCELGIHVLTYFAIDATGNSVAKDYYVKVVGIELLLKDGKETTIYQYSDEYKDPGYTNRSSYGGDVVVTRSGSVNVDAIGTYILTYTATDNYGNTTTVSREVRVIENPNINVQHASTVTQFRKALEDASANGKDDVIILSSGIYVTTSDGQGSFDYNDNEDYKLKIIGNDDDIILDGDDTDRVLDFDNSIETDGGHITLKHLNIRNGSSSAYTGGVDSEKYIKIYNCKIHNHGGRGIFALSGIGLVDSEVYGNTHTGDSQFTGGGIKSNGTTYIANSKIYDNVTEYKGGGVYSYDSLEIFDSEIYNNSINRDFYDTQGGGIYIDRGANKVIVNNTFIHHNRSIYGDGGGIYFRPYDPNNFNGIYSAQIINSKIYSNYAGDSSGGISIGGLIINNSEINNNRARNFGGLYILGDLTMEDCNITNNYSGNANAGGGIFFDGTNVNVMSIKISTSNISDNTIHNNRYNGAYERHNNNYGAGVYVARWSYGEIDGYIINSIIKGNISIHQNGGTSYGVGLFFALGDDNRGISLINNTIVDNTVSGEDAIYGSVYGHGIFANNIFNNNDGAITFSGDSVLINNYIDYTKVINENDYTIIKRDNIIPSSGDVSYNSDFALPVDSILIDKGDTPASAWWDNYYDNTSFYNGIIDRLKKDKLGNDRNSGVYDIGAYEYKD